MKRLKCLILIYIFLIFDVGHTFNIIGVNKQMIYEYIGSVSVGAKSPQDDDHPPPPSSGWVVRGKLTLQRQNENTLAAALSIDEVSLNNSGEKFLQNKEMYPPYKPFKISFANDGTISHLLFKESDPIWSTNFKRAIASILQFQIKPNGAFLVLETGIHGKCSTEYFVSNKTEYITIRKTPELKSCLPYAEAIHIIKSNVPPNLCEFDFQKNVIVGNEAIYGLLPHQDTEYFLNTAHAKGTTLVHTFESTGEAQYINSELKLNFVKESPIDNAIDIETAMANAQSGLELLPLDINDPTGGRHPQLQEALVISSGQMLNALAKGLENSDIKFKEPYDSTVSEIIKLLSQMNYESLQKLYKEVDIGTSYRQETIRNIFFEIIPRIGTKASVQLTRDLVMEKQIKPTTAVQLLISLPFHIYELSHDLVKECEVFLTLGPDSPDVRQAAILSFSTLVHNVFVAGKISKDVFEEYVQKYFNFFLSGHDYEQKMLYLQGLSNLQLGNVANYLDPIVKEENENNDIKFLAAWATMPLAYTRAEKIYELYWPIFESKNATLEMRVAALTLLLVSNPTPARLISIHRIIHDETCPHLINYYRTTIKSISETTFPCYRHLRRLLSYMNRHLPKLSDPRYWVTGNYIFDYRDSKFGIGAMLQTLLVGDPKSGMPMVAYFNFDTEALGKFTGQLALYIKARGLPDAILDRLLTINSDLKGDIPNKINEILNLMKAPKVSYTPLHLEFILQMEGKTVLSYYLNQKTFLNLTYGVLVNRLNFILGADSHINMQTVRWPFMTKYAVPTVVGTTADVLLQTTVLTSLRGNITQTKSADAIKRTHQIDARYSSYASCKSSSYNPFLNLDHEINREQGFLIYMPFSNELSANITDKCLKYSFTRPENLTSGLAFKSRSVTSTKGFITKSAARPFNEVILPERKHDVFQLFKYDTEDLGISVSVNTNLNELNKYRIMLLKSEFMENGFSKNIVINVLMYLFGVAQLSSIHLGHDRNFTLLVYNENSTKIEGSICTTDIKGPTNKIGQKLALTLTHSNDMPTALLHKWNITLDFQSSSKTNWFKMIGLMKRSSQADITDWAACIDMTYAPLVFTKRPHTLNGSIHFGKTTPEKGCPNDASKIEISATAGPSKEAIDFVNSGNTEILKSPICSIDILKFSPIPISNQCKRSNFENLTSITKYDMDLKFSQMPEWFDLWSNRLDHFVSAFSDQQIDRLNLGRELDVSIKTPNDQFWLTVSINGISWRLYQISFLQKFDSFDDPAQLISYDSGLRRSCSLINQYINTFDDYNVNLLDYTETNKTCMILIAADCSVPSNMAIFVKPTIQSIEDTKSMQYGLQVYIGSNYFIYEPQAITNDSPLYITLNGNEQINIRESPYELQLTDKTFEFRIEINEQNILIIENTLMKSSIQFDMLNILNIEIYGVYKNKMCGLCSQPLNRMDKYNICL